MKKFLIFAGIALLVLVAGLSVLGIFLAPQLEEELEAVLSERTGRPVQIDSFGWSVWPGLGFRGEGLTVGRADEAFELFVRVESIHVQPGLFGLLRSPRSLNSITLKNLFVRIPPKRSSVAFNLKPIALTENDSPPLREESPFLVERLVLETAAIELESKDPSKPPRIIQIRTMTMRDIAFGRPSPFQADVHYPHPEGDVLVDGVFGPFDRNDPIRTPVSGHYTFRDADLSAFKEISGILTSEGDFNGNLGENHIEGKATIPEFQLTKAENVVPLSVDFVVDRLGSDVYLRDIRSSFLETEIHTVGEIVRSRAQEGRVLKLDVKGEKSRVEDLLRIALKGDQPPLTGQIQFTAAVTVPPGPGKVIERMEIDGQFQIHEGQFTDPEFQKKLAQISKLGRADRGSDSDDRTFSDLTGDFRMENSEIHFSRLQFGVPGMKVSLTGSYGLQSNQMDFRGRVSLEKAVSEMTSGGLSNLLKILDPLLRGEDGGTSVPIRIRGDRSSPSVSIDF
ncbi:MAG: hypothetical protein JSU96_05375 [Acidobacteriota bacterium]|nr:MAG: hypothetical protein JSU96_05375 [Acidobacteriota bacterium]